MTNKLVRMPEMDSYNLADAKARLSELVERAVAGEDIKISKRGEAQVRLVPIDKPRKKIDIEGLRKLTAGQKMGTGAGSFMRQLRDRDRY
jgi:prevent-host-death family protein